MPLTSLSKEDIDSLLTIIEDSKIRRQLDFIYQRIPSNQCEKCADCCFASAEVHLIEFLNMYAYIQNLPEEIQKLIAERCARYELLSLVTLDYKCPFLEDKQCLIYEVRPLQCRFFGLYPEQDYQELREKSLEQNTMLAQYYARVHRLLLPEEVMTYDIEQCKNNYDVKGKQIILTRYERDLIYNQIVALQNRVFPDPILIDNEDDINRFTYLYCISKFSEDELQKIRVDVVREYLNNHKTSKLDSLIKQKHFDFGMAKVRLIDKELRVKS